MRKILISILIVGLLVLIYFTAAEGFSIFGVDILSIRQIMDKNQDIDNQIEEVSQLAAVSYPKAKKELETSTKKLLQTKDEYADLVSFSTSEDVDNASKLPKYDMDYLRTRFGIYATKNGVKIKIDVVKTSVSDVYNLNFTVTGRYVGITEYIAAIEKDTSFSFRIESFKLVPGTDVDNLQATFSINNVSINNVTSGSTSTPVTTSEDETNNASTNETNTTNTTDTTNETESNS